MSNYDVILEKLTTGQEVLAKGQQDILEVLNNYASMTDSRLQKLESDVGSLKSETMSIRSQMVTKDYLDRKLWNLR